MTLSESFKDMLAVAPAPTQPITKTPSPQGLDLAALEKLSLGGVRPKASALLKERASLKVRGGCRARRCAPGRPAASWHVACRAWGL